MGSPGIPFGSFSCTTLLPGPDIEVVAAHFSQLAETLKEFYPVVGISWEEALRRFSWVLEGRERIKADYSFQAGTLNKPDKWKVIFYRTQIPHLESGLLVGDQNTTVATELASRLVENKLATVVVQKAALEEQRSLLSRLAGPNVGTSLIGEVTGLYLISKFDSIPALQKKWKWEVFKGDSFRFSKFFAEILSTLSTQNPRSIVTLPFDQMGPLRQFVASCDSQLRTALTKRDLERALAWIEVPFDEWFGVKI